MTTPPSAQVARSRPDTPVTWSIIVICFLVWFGELASYTLQDDIVLTPDLGTTQPWRFITSAFAHSTEFLHIGLNMFALWTLRFLEPLFGKAKFAALYLLSAIGGGVLFITLAMPGTQSWYTGVVGASGAIFGLFGSLLPVLRRLRRSMTQIWVVLAINAALTFAIPGIAWQAHVGGFLTGWGIGYLLVRGNARAAEGRPDHTWTYLFLTLLGLILVAGLKYTLVSS